MKNEDIASYADDNTPYVIRDNINQTNQMKENLDKCHLLIAESCKL